MRWLGVPIALAVALAGCGGSTASGSASTAEDTVAMAAEAFDSVAPAFDTVQWKDENAAVVRGSVVWAYSCLKCHGARGEGDGGFVMNGDTLRPPSFLAPDWRFATDTAGLRKAIFTGTAKGMPHWGLVPLPAKDIDAVIAFIYDGLRSPNGSPKPAS